MNRFSRNLVAFVCLILLLVVSNNSFAQSELLITQDWQLYDGQGKDISTGADGSVFYIDLDGNLLGRSYKSSEWKTFTGNFTRVSVDSVGNPWVINASGDIYQYIDGGWNQVGDSATDITVSGKDNIVVTTVTGGLASWNIITKRWSELNGSGVKLAASDTGQVWTVSQDGTIARLLDNTQIGVACG